MCNILTWFKRVVNNGWRQGIDTTRSNYVDGLDKRNRIYGELIQYIWKQQAHVKITDNPTIFNTSSTYNSLSQLEGIVYSNTNISIDEFLS